MTNNNKPLIGIIARQKMFKNDDPFSDEYIILNNYSKRIYQEGGIPVGIIFSDGNMIEEAILKCNGIIIQGGSFIDSTIFNIIKVAMDAKISILGICLGMQSLAAYSANQDGEVKIIEKNSDNSHWPFELNRNTINSLIHDVNIVDKNSILYNCFNVDTLKVNSLHNYHVREIGDLFKITAYSNDGLIEAIESKDPNHFVLGVQWHPEILNDMSPIFKRFIEASQNNKQNT